MSKGAKFNYTEGLCGKEWGYWTKGNLFSEHISDKTQKANRSLIRKYINKGVEVFFSFSPAFLNEYF